MLLGSFTQDSLVKRILLSQQIGTVDFQSKYCNIKRFRLSNGVMNLHLLPNQLCCSLLLWVSSIAAQTLSQLACSQIIDIDSMYIWCVPSTIADYSE